MIKFHTITARNFLSIGNNTQAINLNNECLSLILGENKDAGESDGARNGVGKCVDINTIVKVKDTLTGKIYEITIGDLYNAQKQKTID